MRYKTRVVDGGVEILDYIGEDKDTIKSLKIPNTIGGLKVVGIGDRFLHYNKCLDSISLPESLKSIGDDFLFFNKSLDVISLPESLKSIGDNFLYYNNSLKNISLPESLKSIGDDFLCPIYDIQISR